MFMKVQQWILLECGRTCCQEYLNCGSFVLPLYVFVVMVVKWKKNFIGIITWLMRMRNRR